MSAKKETYAAGKESKKLTDGFEELSYEEGEFFYRDRWKGGNKFGGEEIVQKDSKIIWLMNYYGRIISDKANSELIYKFLREAMGLVEEGQPFRGPPRYINGDFEYITEIEGELFSFKGTEKIFFKGEEVYRLYFHGGEVK